MFRRMMNMSQYNVRLTGEERGEPRKLTLKGGKGCHVKQARILLKPDKVPENAGWTHERTGSAYSAADTGTASTAERFVFEGLEAAPGRKTQENRRRKITVRNRSARGRYPLFLAAGRTLTPDSANDCG
jgi:hypothetical protein